MNHADIAIGVANIILIGSLITGAILFSRRAFALRQERPELLRNGFWFMLPFLLMPLMYLYLLAILPIALIIVLIVLLDPVLRRKPILLKRNAVFWFSLGTLTSGVLIIGVLSILNTYFVH
jgi:hypothetical protein